MREMRFEDRNPWTRADLTASRGCRLATEAGLRDRHSASLALRRLNGRSPAALIPSPSDRHAAVTKRGVNWPDLEQDQRPPGPCAYGSAVGVGSRDQSRPLRLECSERRSLAWIAAAKAGRSQAIGGDARCRRDGHGASPRRLRRPYRQLPSQEGRSADVASQPSLGT